MLNTHGLSSRGLPHWGWLRSAGRAMSLLVLLAGLDGLVAETPRRWDPIPAEAWTIRPGDARYATHGLVLLEARMPFGFSHPVEYFFRFRVLGPEGRELLGQILSFGWGSSQIQGRAVFPDGRAQEFKEGIDFQPKKLKIGRREFTIGVLAIPAGVTTDCIVEWRWQQELTPPPPITVLSRSFPVASTTVILAKSSRLGFYDYNFKASKGVALPKKITLDAATAFRFENLPPYDPAPFCLPGFDESTQLIAFPREVDPERAAKMTPETFWSQSAQSVIDGILKDRESNPQDLPQIIGAFRAMSEPMLKELPDSRQAAALEIWKRLSAHVLNLSHTTEEERKRWTFDENEEDLLGRGTLDVLAFRKRTNSYGMRRLYKALLRKAGIPFCILRVVDGTKDFFDPARLSTGQFQWRLIGVPEEGKAMLWVDSDLRYGSAGMVRDAYLSTLAQKIDLDVKKVSVFEILPSATAIPNRVVYRGALVLDPQSWSISSEVEWTGSAAALRRAEIHAMDSSERLDRLQRLFFPSISDRMAKVIQLRNLLADGPPLGVSLKAQGELAEGRRLALAPFPGLETPVDLPKSWPAERAVPIRIPACFEVQAELEGQLPEGIRIRPQTDLDFKNLFGGVHWEVRQVGQTVRLRLETKLDRMGAAADGYGALREFCGALREAFGRELLLERQ